jgi:hypothetical protein
MNVRFEGNNGHNADVTQCLLLTLSGHLHSLPALLGVARSNRYAKRHEAGLRERRTDVSWQSRTTPDVGGGISNPRAERSPVGARSGFLLKRAALITY